jgi:predicted ATPase
VLGSIPDVGDKGEYAVEAILAAARRGERLQRPGSAKTRPFEEVIAFWLKRLGLISSFIVRPIAKNTSIYRALVQVGASGPEVPLTDVGFGISQVVPVVTLLHYVPQGSTVILEQPEIHLHPLAQAELADLLIWVAEHRRIQIVVESHSEHLLLRLQRRVAEQQISNADVALYFAVPGPTHSNLQMLDLNLYGQIENWPAKFMGDAFGETVEAEKARLIRMQAPK